MADRHAGHAGKFWQSLPATFPSFYATMPAIAGKHHCLLCCPTIFRLIIYPKMRERAYRTEAIVLRRRDFGEADRLLTLYTRNFGKRRAIAKGARKPQSRKTGHVELFMRTKFLIAVGRDLDIITQAELAEHYAPLRDSLALTTYASYVVELLDNFTAENDPNPPLFDLLANSLTRLSAGAEPRLAARYYELRLLALVGYQPQLFECVVTGNPVLEEDQYLSAELGGLISPGNQRRDRRAIPISAVGVKVLRYLQSRSWQTVSSLSLKPALRQELEEALFYYISYILERELKSIDFLKRLREEAALFVTESS